MISPLRNLLLVFMACIVGLCHAQTVQSFCSGPSSLQNQYSDDAWYVAYDYQKILDSASMSNNLNISPDIKSDVLACILGVYNSDLAARDSVVDIYNIHAYKDIDLHRFELYLDTTHTWVSKLLNGSPGATGNVFMDSLANVYGFSIEFSQYFPAWVEDFDALVRIKTNAYVNTEYLAEYMTTLQGVNFANPYTFGGDGNRIYYVRKDTFSELTFRHGWDDCPAGCIQHRDWLFRVYDDCKVQFVSSYGDVITASKTPTEEKFEVKIFPNPASDRVTIQVGDIPGEYMLAYINNSSGKTLRTVRLPIINNTINTELDLVSLPSGIYSIVLKSDHLTFVKKMILVK